MALRDKLRRLEAAARGNMASFELLDGSKFYYDLAETGAELFLAAHDLYLGREPEPPQIFKMICQAKDPEAVLRSLEPASLEHAFVNPWSMYEQFALLEERRLVPMIADAPEDLSEDVSE